MEVLYVLGLICVVLGACYLFYFLGYGNYKSIRAIVFIGKISPKKKQAQISVSACSGFLKRVIWVKKNSQYEFTFDANAQSGNLIVEVLDWQKHVVARLDSTHSTVFLNTEEQRYYLVFHFQKATGDLTLNWQEV